MTENPVLTSTKGLVDDPQFLTINYDQLDKLAEVYASSEMEIPKWDASAFLLPEEASPEEIVDFFVVGNAINFCFTDLTNSDEDVKYMFQQEGVPFPWSGAFGMWAALKETYNVSKERNLYPFDGRVLANLNTIVAGELFEGLGIEIPLLKERVGNLNALGEALLENYGGRAYYLVENSRGFLLGEGGLVDTLVTKTNGAYADFDLKTNPDGLAYFNKRAQLCAAMLIGRFGNLGVTDLQDEEVDKLTVFPDYQLPRVLRHEGCLEYGPELTRLVDNRQIIEQGSLQELEIRAATVHAADYLKNRINERRADKINALHLDYKLFMTTRDKDFKATAKPHHRVVTVAY